MRKLSLFILVLASACDCGSGLRSLATELEVTPALVDFGTVPPGTEHTREVTVRNRGKLALAFEVSTPSAPFGGGGAATRLASGETLRLNVHFHAPQASGDYAGVLAFTAEGDELTVALVGRVANGDAGIIEGSHDAGEPDAGQPDAGAASDAGSPDAGPSDSGATDAGSPDAGPWCTGLGCGDQVALGIGHTCAIEHDGTLRCWGRAEEWGEDGGIVYETPTLVTPYPEPVRGLYAGGAWAAALGVSGHIWVRGYDTVGQLGLGYTQTQVKTPTMVPLDDVEQFSAGFGHACAVTGDGGVWCWGQNACGEVGDGTKIMRLSPVQISVPGAVRQLAAGQCRSCALLQGGTVACWGDRNTPSAMSPQLIAGLSDVTQLASSPDGTCALLGDAGVTCWVDYIGMGPTARSPVPVIPTAQVKGGGGFYCALSTVGSVSCWGYLGQDGQLGDGQMMPSNVPVQASGLGSGVDRLYLPERAGGHACARVRGDELWCWGENILGEVGVGSRMNQGVPAFIMRL